MYVETSSKDTHQVLLSSCSDGFIDAIAVPGTLALIESMILQWLAAQNQRNDKSQDASMMACFKEIEERMNGVVSGMETKITGLTTSVGEVAAKAAAAAIADSNTESRKLFRDELSTISIPDQTASAVALTKLSGEIKTLVNTTNERYNIMAATVDKLADHVHDFDVNTPAALGTHLKNMQTTVDAEYAKVSGSLNALILKLPSTVSDAMVPVITKMDEMTTQYTKVASNGSLKGKDGEERLFAALSECLGRASGDYDLSWTRKTAHSCDMKVTCMNRGDVHIEVKTYNEKVPLSEIKKFHSDLNGLKTHGIMVSLTSGIVGKNEIDMKQLPGGKFAMYVSNNQYDVHMIETLLQFLYKFEDAARVRTDDAVEDTSNVIKLPREILRRITYELQDADSRMSEMRVHLNASLQLLADMSLRTVTKLLLTATGDVDTPHTVPVPIQPKKKADHQCPDPKCGKICGSKAALVKHIQTHNVDEDAKFKRDMMKALK